MKTKTSSASIKPAIQAVSTTVTAMAMAAAACGADGLMIEVHNDPKNALCDGAQSLTPEAFDDVARAVHKIIEAVKEL